MMNIMNNKIYKAFAYNTYIMAKEKKKELGAVPKTITILPRHQKFIEAKSLNLSRFVQKKLDEEIQAQGWVEGQ